jgi:two-component system chemotaxis response regulator CheB
MTKPRVLVVDDSAFARLVLARVLRASNAVDVVGTARDGSDALERIAALDPDVVTLDLTMPVIDGLGVLRALAGRPRPRVVVVSISGVDSELGAEALSLGAVDLVAKPTALASDRLDAIGSELVAKILAVTEPRIDRAVVRPVEAHRGSELVMIGTSTGGPQALTRVLAGLPADLAAPVVMVLHIPAGYTAALAARLDRISALDVVEATDGLVLRPGLAVLARGGAHLRVAGKTGALVTEVSALPIRAFTPSVDELFTSGARVVGPRALGVVLTGMGSDGLEGSRAIVEAGGALLTESAASCVVYGMPRTVQEAGLGAAVALLDDMAKEISRRV